MSALASSFRSETSPGLGRPSGAAVYIPGAPATFCRCAPPPRAPLAPSRPSTHCQCCCCCSARARPPSFLPRRRPHNAASARSARARTGEGPCSASELSYLTLTMDKDEKVGAPPPCTLRAQLPIARVCGVANPGQAARPVLLGREKHFPQRRTPIPLGAGTRGLFPPPPAAF